MIRYYMQQFFFKALLKILRQLFNEEFLDSYFKPYLWKYIVKSQNNNKESELLHQIAEKNIIDPSFIEFGYGSYELNCEVLIKKNFKGLLIDGSKKEVVNSTKVAQVNNFNKLQSTQHMITLNDLGPIPKFLNANDGKLGVLSVDIDGNDYFILKKILSTIKPELIIAEHNSSFGPERSISVAYDEEFDRAKKHSSGFYHGASLKAFCNLLLPKYRFVDNIAGVNLFFLRQDKYKLIYGEKNYIEAFFVENEFRKKNSQLSSKQQFELISDLSFEEV